MGGYAALRVLGQRAGKWQRRSRPLLLSSPSPLRPGERRSGPGDFNPARPIPIFLTGTFAPRTLSGPMNNHLRTFVLLAALTALFMGVGYLIGGPTGMGLAFLFAAGM